jgi:ribose/xylose/arabinose/galactoside ABC-type transport system permease subunit
VAKEAAVTLPPRWRRPVQLILEQVPALTTCLILLTLVCFVPAFRRPAFWLSLGQQYFAPALLALVLTPIVLTGGIDLSVGSVAVFVSVVIGALLRDAHWSISLALTAGLVAGLLAGLLNGGLVVVGVTPLVATLATRELFRGLALSIGGDTPVSNLPTSLTDLWRVSMLGVRVQLLAIAGLFLVCYVLVQHTWVGRMIYAVGDNEEAARFAGVPVKRLKLGLYTAAGLVAGVCGAGLVLRFGAARADAEKTLELTAISCVVLGGIRISGGAGHVAGALLGIVTVAGLLTGLSVVSPTIRDMILGVLLIIVAVGNETARRTAARLKQQTESFRRIY